MGKREMKNKNTVKSNTTLNANPESVLVNQNLDFIVPEFTFLKKANLKNIDDFYLSKIIVGNYCDGFYDAVAS